MKTFLPSQKGAPTEAKSDNKQPIKGVKYPHPKIMLVNVTTDAATLLREKGYNVSEANLGQPYSVKRETGFYPVLRDRQLPQDYKEHEIVIIDLHYDTPPLKENISQDISDGVNYWLVSHESGYVNPFLLNGLFVRDDFNRILNTGGVFIVFANQIEFQEFVFGNYSYYGAQEIRKQIGFTWGFLAATSSLRCEDDHGSMLYLHDKLPKQTVIAQILLRHLNDAKYSCTLSSNSSKVTLIPLLRNKFGACAAGLIPPSDDQKGTVIILPDIADKPAIISDLITEFLPTFTPTLFPDMEKCIWENYPEYELSSVIRLQQKIIEIEEKAQSEIKFLEKEIRTEKNKAAYIFDLASQTGDSLVRAVYNALITLGFHNVIDADKELIEQGIQNQNREDLQIQDYDPTLIIEVKGISHYPSDDDALTVQKYVVLRMKEWKRVNVEGLSVINHQRHLPPLDRDNNMPFRKELVTAAEEQGIGLITGWDFHRLVRSFISNNWQHEQVKGIFYKFGRLSIVPSHYKYIGTIERYIDKINVLGIQLTDSLRQDDRIAYELPIIFKEELCNSLQYENRDIAEAQPGMLIGLKTTLTKEEARTGVRVFRILTELPESKDDRIVQNSSH